MQLLEAQHCIWGQADRPRDTASTWQRGDTGCQCRAVIARSFPDVYRLIVCSTGAEELATVLSDRVLLSVPWFLQVQCLGRRL